MCRPATISNNIQTETGTNSVVVQGSNTVHSNESEVNSTDYRQTGTTSMPSSNNVVVSNAGSKVHVDTMAPIRDQSIMDFMAKPYIKLEYEWTTTSLANDQLWSDNVGDNLTSSGPDVWWSKIKGFAFIRGTAVYRVVINANPFQQGRLLLCFTPGASVNETAPTRVLCRASATQLPSVQLDCRDGACELRVPYISPTDWMSTYDSLFGHGAVSLRVLSPLNTGAAGNLGVDITVFLHFEDVELAGPIYPQSSLSSSGSSRSKKVKRRAAGISVGKQEASSMVSKPLSTSLSLVSKAADTLSGIPLISSVAGPVAWFTRAASQAASAFGWSKPEVDKAHSVMTKRTVPFMGSSTGSSSAMPMSLLHDNSLLLMDDFAGCEHDEMSFNYIKSREAFYDEFTLAVSNAPGTALKSFPVAPSVFGESFSITHTNTNTYIAFAPFAFLSRYFTFWRGSVKIRLVFVKTDFHTGRLLITYQPQNAAGPVYPNASQSAYSMREIVDLKNVSEVTLEFPFIQDVKWLYQSVASGFVRISVLNELRAPETCAQSIQVLMFVSAGQDFEYNGVDRSSDLEDNAVFFPQMDDSALPLISEVIGGYTQPSLSMEPSSLTMGEQFTSVRQLVSRYCPLLGNTLMTNGASNIAGVYPWQMQLCGTSTADNSVIYPAYGFDPLSEISSGFALFRGSLKILIHNINGTQPLSAVVTTKDVASGSFSTVNTTPTTLYGVQQLYASRAWNSVISYGPVSVSDSYNGIHEFKIPYYCRTHSSWVANRASKYGLNTYSSTPAATWDDKPCTYLQYVSEGTTNTQTHLYRSIGEDFQLGYFVGFAPVRLT